MAEKDSRAKLALALDVRNLQDARRLMTETREHVGVYKVGLELFVAEGPAAVEAVLESGRACFLDLKLHDIPATMARAVTRASALGVDYLTVHAAAGDAALGEAAARAGSVRLLAVTVLTSFDADSLARTGMRGGPSEAASHLAELAWEAGIRGFVTSPHECAILRDTFGHEAFLVTPGVRPKGSAAGDQRRVMTPGDAIGAGADLLVIGRPIRDADDPARAAASVAAEIESALRP